MPRGTRRKPKLLAAKLGQIREGLGLSQDGIIDRLELRDGCAVVCRPSCRDLTNAVCRARYLCCATGGAEQIAERFLGERLTALAKLLPERDPHTELYYGALQVLQALDDAGLWPALLVRWEMMLLQDLGFGLDLSECAATGTDADLVYVSPKSGRAVSRDAGQPYCDRLLKLPRFLLEDDASPAPPDILVGFGLTGHFLERDVLAPLGLTLPQSRERLIEHHGLLAVVFHDIFVRIPVDSRRTESPAME